MKKLTVLSAIALVVMILIVLIFTKNLDLFRVKVRMCETNGGQCVDDRESDTSSTGHLYCNGEIAKIVDYTCPEKKICCMNNDKK